MVWKGGPVACGGTGFWKCLYQGHNRAGFPSGYQEEGRVHCGEKRRTEPVYLALKRCHPIVRGSAFPASSAEYW